MTNIDIKRGDRGPEVRQFQEAIDRELKEHKFPWRKVKIDGQAGEHTFDAANMVAFLKGFSGDALLEIGKRQRITHRARLILEETQPRTTGMKHRSHAREDDVTKLREEHQHPKPQPKHPGSHITWLDGHEVPIWIAEILIEARNSGAWHGVVISGVRSPQYSEELCLNMCGAPTCSGRCAGRSSNHAMPPTGTGVEYEGAVDVTGYAELRVFCEQHHPELRGGGQNLPSDLPHFSHEGN